MFPVACAILVIHAVLLAADAVFPWPISVDYCYMGSFPRLNATRSDSKEKWRNHQPGGHSFGKSSG